MAGKHRRGDLVEPEGVNADPTTEHDTDPHADVRKGGDPDGPRPDTRAEEPKVVSPEFQHPDPHSSSVEWYAEEGAE